MTKKVKNEMMAWLKAMEKACRKCQIATISDLRSQELESSWPWKELDQETYEEYESLKHRAECHMA